MDYKNIINKLMSNPENLDEILNSSTTEEIKKLSLEIETYRFEVGVENKEDAEIIQNIINRINEKI